MTYLRKERRRAEKMIGQAVERETGLLLRQGHHRKLELGLLQSKRWRLKGKGNLARKCWRRKVEANVMDWQILI